MAWIESHQSLAKHRKTLRAASILQIDRATLIGHLHLLWWWGLDNAGIDGELGDVTPYEIAMAAEWPGDPGLFVNALIEAGFIDRDDHGLRLHDWYDYAGKLNERRIQERERSKQRRSSKRPAVDQATTSGRPAVDHQTTVGTLPNLTIPNQINNTLLTRASPDDDARSGNGQSPADNNSVDDVETAKVTVQPDEQTTNGRAAGQDPGGSVEAVMVTATPGEQRAKTPWDDAGEKPKPRPPFTSKKQEQLFDQFWELYPKKKSKGQAEKVWARLRPDDELFSSILAGLERAKASYDWQKEGGKYIPYPATWLNAKGWEDEYTPAVPRAAPVKTQTQAQERRRRLPSYIVAQLEAERQAVAGSVSREGDADV